MKKSPAATSEAPSETPLDPRSRAGSVSDSIFMSFNSNDDDPAVLGSLSSAARPLKLGQLAPSDVPNNNNSNYDGDAAAIAKAQQYDATRNPSTEIRLSALRFIAVVLLGVGVVVSVMVVFLRGVTIKRGVADPIGSSKNADDEVEFYQTISGYLTAAFGMIVEKYFAIFLAVMLTYFGNIKLYPGDRPTHGKSRRKRFALFCFSPLIIYIVNIGLSSLFIQHSTSGVQRVFVKQDLVTTAFVTNVTTKSNTTTPNVENTILRSAVLRQVVPFEILSDSACKLENATSEVDSFMSTPAELPAVKEIRSTTVDFGFQVQDWNRAVFPTGLTPTHMAYFSIGKLEEPGAQAVEDEFTKFQQDSGFDFLTGYELLLQGKTLFERAVSDANSSAYYPCTLVDGLAQDDGENSTTTFPTFSEGPYKSMRMCVGAISSLPDLATMADKATHNLRSFATTIAKGFNTTLKQIAPEEITVTVETYTLTSQMSLTAMSIDIPYAKDAQYRDLSEYCTDAGKIKPSVVEEYTGDTPLTTEEIEVLQDVLCSQSFYPFDKPNSLCGSENCVFLDKSTFGVHLRKQLLLMPYLKNCRVTNMTYNNDVLNFLPSNCTPVDNSVFLYGLGSYMSGEDFDLGFTSLDDSEPSSVPSFSNPRRRLTLSFAKLDWKLEDLSAVFGAKCGVPAPGNCDGLVFMLSNTSSSSPTQALLLGKDSIPNYLADLEFYDPVQLVSLNTRPFYYEKYKSYFEWEYLDTVKHFAYSSTSSSTGSDASNSTTVQNQKLSGSGCSLLIDSYLHQVKSNHYYLDDPLQALYTSAIYYLFQDAAVKSLNVAKKKTVNFASLALQDTGVRFAGDRERKQIKYSIPLVSAVGTFIGLTLLFVFGAIVVLFPRERLRKTDEPNAAARYADVLTDDVYHAAVHKRQLVYRSTSSTEDVERERMDDYIVDSITFHHQRDQERKVFM